MLPADLPRRLLLGPGPSNVHPRVREAMARPLVGHMDPAFFELLDTVQHALRALFGTRNPLTLPISATGSAGMEACFVNLVEPGDAVLVGVAGVFGNRMAEVAARCGAEVTRVETPLGTPLDADAMTEAIARVRPRIVSFVHAETSTGVLQPVDAIAAAGREAGALVVTDCVTSLGGVGVALDEWGVDAAYSATQKCLSCAPGLSPVSFSPQAVERAANRTTPVQSWFLDVNLLANYVGEARVYHHTAPVSAIFGLAEGLRLIEEEGIETRTERHRRAAHFLIEGMGELGFEPLVEAPFRLPSLTTLTLPEKVERGEAELRRRLLETYNIEVGGGLGPLEGKIWRVGLMGENARITNVEALLSALRREIR